MSHSLKTFTGEFPAVNTALLPEGAAQDTLDCDFSAGTLTGLRERKPIPIPLAAASTKALYAHADAGLPARLFAWGYDVDAVRGPVANDAYKRFYWTDGETLYVSRGDVGNGSDPKASGNAWKAGVPEPTVAPVLSSGTGMFALPNTVSVQYFRACETVNGVLTDKVALTPTTRVTDRHSETMEFDLSGSSCMGARAGVAVIYAGAMVVGTTPTMVTDPSSGIPSWNGTYTTLFEISYKTLDGRRYYFRKELGYSPGPASVALANSGSQPYIIGCVTPDSREVKTMYRLDSTLVQDALGNWSLWYCSDSGAPEPTFDLSDSGVAGLATMPVVIFEATMTNGQVATGILRSAGESTLPLDFASYGVTLVIDGTTAKVAWQYSGDDMQNRDYTYTYVNAYGEESAPSSVLSMEAYNGEALAFSATLPPLNHGYVEISKVRFYRTATGASGDTRYLFIRELNPGETLLDDVKTENLGEPLATLGFRPPETGLRGLVALPNGVLAAFKGNEIHFSEPYLPYAWKSANILTTLLPVVALCAGEGGLYATTRGEPYFVSGITPDAMSQQKLQVAQAGVSKGSIVNVGTQVAYASNDGLVLLQGGQATLEVSFKFFTRQEWRDRYGAKLGLMRLSAHDGRLVCWFEDGTPGFMLRFDETQASFTKLSEPIYAAVVHPDADALYVAVGNTAFEFCGLPTTRPFVWQTKDFIETKPLNYGALQLVGDGAVTVTVYADEVAVLTTPETLTPDGSNVIRLPSGFLARKWSVRLAAQANTEVRELNLVGSVSELIGV